MHWPEAGRQWAACGAVGGGPPFPRHPATAPRSLFSAPGVYPRASETLYEMGYLWGGEPSVRTEAESGFRTPSAGAPGVPSAQRRRLAGFQIRENPTGETSMCDVIILGDVTGPPGSARVPAEEASLELRRARAPSGKSSGTAARLHRALCLSYRSRAAPGEACPRAHRRHGKERAPLLLPPAGARTT